MDKGFTVVTDIEHKELLRKAKFYDKIKARSYELMYKEDFGDISINLVMIGEEVCEELGYD